jgi:RHS repeat-associated protein
LINDGSALYRYDRANRLISTTLSGATTLFNYNGDGVRLKQVVAGVVTTYTQDIATPLPVVLQSKTGVTTTKYLYSEGTRPVAQNATAWEYLLPDGLGSVRQIADVNGYLIRTQDYEPYGSLLNGSGSGQSVYGFAGEERDTTGLIYLRARYMQPTLGIFLARDSWSGEMLRPGSMNGYSYVEGNPINYIDPVGLRRYRIWASAFIPWDQIEFFYEYGVESIFPVVTPAIDWHAKWHGDNRGFASGDSEKVFKEEYSARAWHEILIDTNILLSNPAVFYNATDTHPTIVYYTDHGTPRTETRKAPSPERASVSRDPNNWCIIRVTIQASGSNPLVSESPPVVYEYELDFDTKKGELRVSGRYTRFPAHELYVTGVGPIVNFMPDGPARTPADLFLPLHLFFDRTFNLPHEDGPCGCQ